MPFADVLFPKDISYGSQGGPQFNTSIVANGAMREQRNRNLSQPTWKFNTIYGVKKLSQYQSLYNFFLARGGKWQSFRYEDPIDHTFTNELLGVGDGTLTVFQSVKNYVSGSDQLVRTITKLVAGTVRIYTNDILLTSGFTTNLLTGIHTFSSPPAPGVIVRGSATFHVPARFDIDYLPAIVDATNGDEFILNIENIPVVEAPGE